MRPSRCLPLSTLLPLLLTHPLVAGDALHGGAASRIQPPPAPLACVARLYGGAPELSDGEWTLNLPDGQRIRYDDHRSKSFEERLESPDLEDMFSIRYQPGAIRPVDTPDEDPGRIRVDALFSAAYGSSRANVDVIPIRFLDQRLEVHRKVAPAFLRVAARLERVRQADPSVGPFLQHLGGTFVWRAIAGTERRSAHAYGISIDLNVARSHYWRWQKPASPLKWTNRVPQSIVEAFEAEGFIWGGRWYHYDTMHFEYRPELLDPACYAPPPDAVGAQGAGR
jgi:hypothetical protein